MGTHISKLFQEKPKILLHSPQLSLPLPMGQGGTIPIRNIHRIFKINF